MLYVNGHAQVMKAADKYQYVVWETLKCLDQHFVCHVDNQCYESYAIICTSKEIEKTQG